MSCNHAEQAVLWITYKWSKTFRLVICCFERVFCYCWNFWFDCLNIHNAIIYSGDFTEESVSIITGLFWLCFHLLSWAMCSSWEKQHIKEYIIIIVIIIVKQYGGTLDERPPWWETSLLLKIDFSETFLLCFHVIEPLPRTTQDHIFWDLSLHTGLMIESSWVQILAGVAGEFFSLPRVNFLCWYLLWYLFNLHVKQ